MSSPKFGPFNFASALAHRWSFGYNVTRGRVIHSHSQQTNHDLLGLVLSLVVFEHLTCTQKSSEGPSETRATGACETFSREFGFGRGQEITKITIFLAPRVLSCLSLSPPLLPLPWSFKNDLVSFPFPSRWLWFRFHSVILIKTWVKKWHPILFSPLFFFFFLIPYIRIDRRCDLSCP